MKAIKQSYVEILPKCTILPIPIHIYAKTRDTKGNALSFTAEVYGNWLLFWMRPVMRNHVFIIRAEIRSDDPPYGSQWQHFTLRHMFRITFDAIFQVTLVVVCTTIKGGSSSSFVHINLNIVVRWQPNCCQVKPCDYKMYLKFGQVIERQRWKCRVM